MACQFPYLVKSPHRFLTEGYSSIPVPCGKCYDCKMRIVSQWAFRLRQQEKTSDNALFLTLTYGTEYVPITNNGFMSLKLEDVQKFFKRLRKRHPRGHSLYYFAVGEYGTERKRPHYHIILFNCDPKHISPSWTLGDYHIGRVTGASIAYTLKYMMKEPSKKHIRDDRKPEFRCMSKKLGINYLTKEMVRYHRSNEEKLYSVIEDGIKVPLARYYRNKIWSETEQVTQGAMIRARIEKQLQQKQKKDENYIEKERRGAEVRNKRSYRNAKNRNID